MKQKLTLAHHYRPSVLTENAPLLLMLHGYGSDHNDLFSFASELPEQYAIISLKAPIAIQPHGNAWYPIYFDASNGKFSDTEKAIESRDLVLECLEDISNKYPIDQKNITLLGFSQGTILSLAIALSYPQKIKNVIALSGYINEDILGKQYHKNDFSSLNIYASHGYMDQVIPVEWARKTPVFLNNIGIKHTYSEFPVGHGVAPQNFHEFKKWLEDN